MGYATATPAQMITHLVDAYGTINARELGANLVRLAAPWDPETPIEIVFTNGTNYRQLFKEDNDPISDAAYIRILVKIFKANGVFDSIVADCQCKPISEQTIPNVIAHFQRDNTFRLEEH
jgi:hypothetical protein